MSALKPLHGLLQIPRLDGRRCFTRRVVDLLILSATRRTPPLLSWPPDHLSRPRHPAGRPVVYSKGRWNSKNQPAGCGPSMTESRCRGAVPAKKSHHKHCLSEWALPPAASSNGTWSITWSTMHGLCRARLASQQAPASAIHRAASSGAFHLHIGTSTATRKIARSSQHGGCPGSPLQGAAERSCTPHNTVPMV